MTGTAGEGRRGLGRDEGRIDPQQGYTFMKAHRAEFSLVAMCRALRLSPSGYYDWLKRASPPEPSPPDDQLRDESSGNLVRDRWEVRPSTNPCHTAGAGRPREHEVGSSLDEEHGASWGRVWNVVPRRKATRNAGK